MDVEIVFIVPTVKVVYIKWM